MDTVKLGLNLALRYIGGIIMSFVIFLSFGAIFTLPLTQAIGYDAYVSDNATGQSTKVYTHYFAHGEDTKKAEYEAKGLTVYTAEVRSELTGAGNVLMLGTAQAVSLAFFVSLVPSRLYRLGAKDAQDRKARCGARWLVPTLFPGAISLAGFVLLVLSKLQLMGNAGLSFYRYANYHLYGLLRLIIGAGNDATQISWGVVVLAILPAVLTVVACGIGYEIGYRDIHPLLSLKNKIKYKRDT